MRMDVAAIGNVQSTTDGAWVTFHAVFADGAAHADMLAYLQREADAKPWLPALDWTTAGVTHDAPFAPGQRLVRVSVRWPFGNHLRMALPSPLREPNTCQHVWFTAACTAEHDVIRPTRNKGVGLWRLIAHQC